MKFVLPLAYLESELSDEDKNAVPESSMNYFGCKHFRSFPKPI